MVEAGAAELKLDLEQFLTESQEGSLNYDAPEFMVSEKVDKFQYRNLTQHRKFLVFLDGKWVQGAAARAQTRSVEEGIQQQIELVGSRAIYDRASYHLARLDISSDPYFIREQLLLFKWRVDFVAKFFPIEAAVYQYLQGLTCSPVSSPGWWHCFGAAGLPGGPGTRDFYPEFALAGMVFDYVLYQAFHMGENVVNFDQAWETTPSEIRDGSVKGFATFGGDYDYKYWLVYDDPAEEEHAFKWVHSVHEDAWGEGTGMPLNYLERVVVALHRQGPPLLTHLAIKRVLELELSQDELPEEVKEMIAEGPDVKLSEVTTRGQHLLEVLRKKEVADMEQWLQDELDEEEEELSEDVE